MRARIQPFLFLVPLLWLVPWSVSSALWGWDLHFAKARGFVFGVDQVSLWGPFGFLLAPVDYPATQTHSLVVWILAAAAYAWVLFHALPKKNDRELVLYFVLTVFAGSSTFAFFYSALVLWLATIFLPVTDSKRRLLVVLAALGSAIHFWILVSALIVGLIVTVHEVRSSQKVRSLIEFLSGYIIFWFVGGQSLVQLPLYLSQGFGFANAFPFSFPTLICQYSGPGLLVGFLLLWKPTKALGVQKIFLIGLLGILHALTFGGPLYLHPLFQVLAWTMVLLFGLALLKETNTSKRYSLVGLFLFGVFLCSYAAQTPLFSALTRPFASDALATYRDSLRTEIGELYGRVDIYPNKPSVPVILDFDYSPRPIRTSSWAMTPELSRLNEAHLLNEEKGPQQVLLKVKSVHRRLPTADDNVSWPLFLSHFDIQKESEGYLVLSRKEAPVVQNPKELAVYRSEVGQEVLVPSLKAPIWVSINIKKSPLARLLGATSFAPGPKLVVKLITGEEKTFAIRPHMVADGLLVSPLLETNQHFADLHRGDWVALKDREVLSVKVELPGAWYGSSEIDVEFFEVNPS